MPFMPFSPPVGPADPQAQQPAPVPSPYLPDGVEMPDDLSGMDPEVLQRLAALGVIPQELADNAMRERQAFEAASASGPEGRQVGGTFVAASPLEHLASAGTRIAALRRQKKLQGERDDLLKRQRAGHYAAYELYGAPKPFGF